MEKQFTKRTCDSPVCDTTDIVDQQAPNLRGLSRWVNIIVTKLTPDGKQLQPIVKQACRVQCAVNILNTLDVSEPEEKPTEKVNLDELKHLAYGERTPASDAAQPESVPAGQ